jgi:acetamidase/formamidase
MAIHHLKAGPGTVRVGVIDRAHAPLLRVDPGDELHLSTLGLWADEVGFGEPFEKVARARARYAGRGPHSITGPVAVRGARPGDVLRVDILELRVGERALNVMTPGSQSRGVLAADFANGSVRHFRLDRERMTTDFGYGIEIALTPFLGIMGVAPPGDGPHISSVPGPFGGNIDCADLVAGTTLYLPVWADEALFYAGDAHAAQGHGEVNGTALETSMELARLRLALQRGEPLAAPQAETPAHWITMDFDPDLTAAARRALAAMVDLIARRNAMPREDAYRLCSIAADLIVTQMVNGHQGIHVKLPKTLLRPTGANRQ